jgi:hypothetical protein
MLCFTWLNGQLLLIRNSTYSGLQMYAPFVGAILVIAQTTRAKTSFASTKDGSHTSENRYSEAIFEKEIASSLKSILSVTQWSRRGSSQ